MRMTWKKGVIALLSLTLFAACSDDDPTDDGPGSGAGSDSGLTVADGTGVYVLNQGSYGYVDGTLNYVDLATGTVERTDLFANANEGRSMGDTPQDILIYGSHLYLAVYGSDRLWVLDSATLVIDTFLTVSQPRDLVAEGGKIYVSNYNGYVTRVDTASLAIDGECAVGVYPEQMAVRDGYLYVVNSYGLTATAEGCTVTKVDLQTFSKAGTIDVGLNPTKIIADGDGNLFVTLPGDYSGATQIKKIDADDAVSYVTDGVLAAAYDGKLYVINTIYDSYWQLEANEVTCIDIATGEAVDLSSPFEVTVDCNPQSLTVDEATGLFYVTGYPSDDFLGSGYLQLYTAAGDMLVRYSVGLNPVAVAFVHPE